MIDIMECDFWKEGWMKYEMKVSCEAHVRSHTTLCYKSIATPNHLITVIINFLTNPCYIINVDWFSLGWSKKNWKKKIKWLTQKCKNSFGTFKLFRYTEKWFFIFIHHPIEVAQNKVKNKTDELGINGPISWTRRVQNASKNQYRYAHQSRITYPSLLCDTL